MAVLPTPGSPIRTGLFLVRRLSTWMTRRISSSRPMTGIELAAAGQFGQVLGVFFQGLELAFGILVGDALRPAHRGERLENGVVRRAQGDQRIARRIALEMGHAQQQMLGRNVLVLEVRGLAKGLVERLVERLAQAGLRGRTGHARQFFLDRRADRCSSRSVGTPIFSSTAGITPSRSSSSASKQVHGLQLGVAQLRGARLRLLHCLLRLDGKFVPTNGHDLSS